ncbi:MAG: hypothetical protein L0229_27295, partial [Blastocatellia bacterium]|nr:hypothetical protein [Blastocatellia bacterium]
MEQVIDREESIKKYILGELTEDEQAEVEIRLLTEEGYLDELLLVEDELTDDLVFGVLSEYEQESIRRYFSNIPKQQEKVRLTRALERYISEHATVDASAITWESALAEAQENRYLLESLVAEDWRGLHLLALLRSSPQDKIELSRRLQITSAAIISALVRLIECGVVEEWGEKFFCTRLGMETLVKMEKVSGVKIIF